MPWEIGTPYPSSLAPKTLDGLPDPAGMRTGASFAVIDYGGNIATVVAGAWRFEYPFRTTWAGRPPVGIVPAGTELQVTDYNSQKWICDGTVWRPAQGRVVIKGNYGLFASGGQIAQLSGVTWGLFAIPGGCKIPAGMIIQHSRLFAQADGYKTGANGQGTFSIYLGTANTAGDSTVCSQTISLASNTNTFASSAARFGSATDKFNTRNWQGEGVSAASSNSAGDRNTNINTNADMWLNVGVSSANASDVFNLMSLQVVLEA